MFYKSTGIVLRETDYKDADRILTVLTKEYGLVSLKARGVRRNSSVLKSACQLLTYSEFTWQEYKGKYTITEAMPLEQFREKNADIILLALCSYFAQVAETFSQEDWQNPDLLSLLLNSIYAVCSLKKNTQLVKTAFELRTACIAGYQPDLSGCDVCGCTFPEFFSITQGNLSCASCIVPDDGNIRVPVSEDMLRTMRYILSAPLKKLFSFSVDAKTLEKLNFLSEAYLSAQAECSFFTLDFYKSLFLRPENRYV